MAGYRPPYTQKEEIEMLEYIIEQKAFHRLRGIQFWQEMQDAGVGNNRTYHSLKEHFRKAMVPKLSKIFYKEIKEEDLQKIKQGFRATAVGQPRNFEQTDKRWPDLSKTPPSSDSETE